MSDLGLRLLNGMEVFKTADVTEIMYILDWHSPPEIQAKVCNDGVWESNLRMLKADS